MNKKIFSLLLLVGMTYFTPNAVSQTKPNFTEVKVTLGSISTTILTTGTVQPQNRLEIKPPIAGRVEEVLVNEGDNVAKGQLLAWMSSTERAALLDAARAVSPAELAKWQEYYKPTPVYAPIAGTVILRAVEPGQTFTAADAVFVLSDRLAVKAQVDETDLGQVRLNQPATIVLDAYAQNKIKGHVSHIAYEATTVNNVTTYLVDVVPEEAPEYMRSGMTANITFDVGTKSDVLVIPQSAVKYKNGRPFVLTPSSKKTPIEVPVELGDAEGEMIEVKTGLQLHDTILVADAISFGTGDEGGSPFMPKFRRRK